MMDREQGGQGGAGRCAVTAAWVWGWLLRSIIGGVGLWELGVLGCITKHVNKCAWLRLTRGFDASFMVSDGIPRRSSHILLTLIIQHVYPGKTYSRALGKIPTGSESPRGGEEATQFRQILKSVVWFFLRETSN